MSSDPVLDRYGAPVLIGAYVVLLVAEAWRPLRDRAQARRRRYPANVVLAVAAFAVLRLALIPVVVLVAAWCQRRQFGVAYLLPGSVPAADVLRAAAAVLVLDYTMYWWHRFNHVVPALWRFHVVHHTDLDLDVTTAARFHFGEIAMSVLVRSAQVALAGATPFMALLYEVLLEAETQFHHSNWRLPIGVERVLSWVVVTPRMHGIHHSVVRASADSNFSNIFTWWDRLHRTVRLNVPQHTLRIGVAQYRDPAGLTAAQLLRMPFTRQRPAAGDGDKAEVLVGHDPGRLAE